MKNLKKEKDVLRVLQRGIAPHEIDWRIMRDGVKGDKPWAIIVPYIDGRAAMERLDEATGSSLNWDDEYTIDHNSQSVVCHLTLTYKANNAKDEELILTATHEDGASFTGIEPIKGGISDSLKRACTKFGLARDLYTYDTPIFANINDNGEHRGSHKAKDGKRINYRWDVPSKYILTEEDKLKAVDVIHKADKEWDQAACEKHLGWTMDLWTLADMKELRNVYQTIEKHKKK